MNKSRGPALSTLVIEVSRYASGAAAVLISIPGREGTSERVWASPLPWDDIQATTLAALSDFLWLSGGAVQALPGIDPG